MSAIEPLLTPGEIRQLPAGVRISGYIAAVATCCRLKAELRHKHPGLRLPARAPRPEDREAWGEACAIEYVWYHGLTPEDRQWLQETGVQPALGLLHRGAPWLSTPPCTGSSSHVAGSDAQSAPPANPPPEQAGPH